MNWRNFLGEELYNKMENYLSTKKMTIATFVRLAIESYIERG
jgi:predicted DNA-binding protein